MPSADAGRSSVLDEVRAVVSAWAEAVGTGSVCNLEDSCGTRARAAEQRALEQLLTRLQNLS